MKKQLLKPIGILILLILTQQLFSQHIITNNYNLEIGDTYRNDLYDEVTDIDPGPAGPNQSWDFSEITGGVFTQGVNNVCVHHHLSLLPDI